jgi:hypothetical protein
MCLLFPTMDIVVQLLPHNLKAGCFIYQFNCYSMQGMAFEQPDAAYQQHY